MRDKLIKQIEEKQLEVNNLKLELEKLNNHEYTNLIGKCYKLSASSVIKLTSVGYVENNKVNFECIKIYGGEHACGAISVDMNDDCFLNIKDINDGYIKEITNEEFIIFLNKAFDKTINTINDIINV
jgi:hypothetical protein